MANALTAQTAHGTLAVFDGQTPPQPASVEPGSVVWASSDPTVLTVVAAADGMSFDVTTVAPGTARLSVTADADLGAGIQTITGTSEDVVVAQNPNTAATSFTITFGPFSDLVPPTGP